MKKKTTEMKIKKITDSSRIANSLESIDSSLKLLVSRNQLFDAIEEHAKLEINPEIFEKGKSFQTFDEPAKDIKNIVSQIKWDYVDSDIYDWFPNYKKESCSPVSIQELIFKKSITHGEILSELEKSGVQHKFPLTKALYIANSFSTYMEKGTYRIIYLTDTYNGTPCRLSVWRSDDGQLNLNVVKVNLGIKWYSGNGVLVSNENLVG